MSEPMLVVLLLLLYVSIGGIVDAAIEGQGDEPRGIDTRFFAIMFWPIGAGLLALEASILLSDRALRVFQKRN